MIYIPYDLILSIARNSITPNFYPGHRALRVRGQNDDIDTTTSPEDLWIPGGTYVFPSGNTAMQVVSGSASDTASGTGLRSVRVSGLNVAYQEIEEIIALNGTTPVSCVNQYFRVNTMIGLTCGSGEFNAGDVDMRAASGGTVYSRMGAGDGIAKQAIYTVPSGWSAYSMYFYTSLRRLSGAEYAEMHIKTRTSPGAPWVDRHGGSPMTQGSSAVVNNPIIPPVFPEMTDFKVTCSTTSANNCGVSCLLELLLIRNH